MYNSYVKVLPTENFLARVYGWLAAALTLTASTAFLVASTPTVYTAIINNPLLLWGLVIAQLGFVAILSGGLQHLSYSAALTLFLLYAATVGVSFSLLILFYTGASLALTFATSALMFAVMALYGYTTRANLSSMRNIFTMLVVGLVISMIINIFLRSSFMDLMISGVGVVLFCGLIAFDMQRLKHLAASAFDDITTFNKYTLLGALTIYIDLLNLFIFLLRFLGKRRED